MTVQRLQSTNISSQTNYALITQQTKSRSKTKQKTCLILFLSSVIFCLLLMIFHPLILKQKNLLLNKLKNSNNQKSLTIKTSQSKSDEIIEKNAKEVVQRKRNLSVWTRNCCPTTQSCGVLFQDCCQIDVRGCNWYIFCYTIADDNNCSRVATIVQTADGYWAI